MTSPEDDDGLEEELRRALNEAANEVKPGSDGLDKIRARIAGRPPRPWLRSVLFGIVERVRNWTWRGHWAWPDWRSRLAEVRWPHLRRGSFPAWGIGSLQLASILAGVAVIASVTLSVQPVRDAILQASTVLTSGNLPQPATAQAQANGTRAVAGKGTPSPDRTASGGTQIKAGSSPRPAKAASTAKPLASPAKKSPKPKPTPTPSATSPAPNDSDAYGDDSTESDVAAWTPTPTAVTGRSGYGWPRPAPPFRQDRSQYASRYGRWR